MENYTYPTYPDSGESSPRSREIDFENPPPWDEQQPAANYKAKFMCSYGGKIQPRSHDNQLSYVGGDTKILAVDRNIKFPAFLSRLASLCDCPSSENLTLKYQLPGEDLDALISVTNDDDLDHMMHEYDRLFRASAKPARMRLFLFAAATSSGPPSFSSDRDRFVDALNSGPGPVQPDPVKPAPVAPPSNVDFLFGLEKAAAPPPQSAPPLSAVKFHDPVPEPVAPPPEYQSRGAVNDRVIGSDPNVNPVDVQRQLQQELQRLQIAESDQSMYRRRSEDGFAGGYGVPGGGDYYAQKMPEKVPMSNSSATVQHPGNYWPEKQFSGEGSPAAVTSAPGGGDQPFYVVPAPGTFYHAPMVRPAAPQPVTQGYYAVQRMSFDGYREQPVYGGVPPPKVAFSSAGPTNLAPAQPGKASTYPEGYGVVRPAGVPDNAGAAAYAQMAYDSASGRHVYYTAPGGAVHAPPYHGFAPAVGADMRAAAGGSLGQDVNKVVNKVSQGSV